MNWIEGSPSSIIFDDTFFHRSTNDVEQVRYCLFMDIVRPNRWDALFDVAVHAVKPNT